MSFTYEKRRRAPGQEPAEPERKTTPGPDMNALMSGRARPSAAQKGRPIDLDAEIKAKMEHAFGDLSGVKLYESQTAGDAGAEAIAMGNEIAFAPGMSDFSTRAGQERLGHELSHVMSQRSGWVQRTGFLNDPSLEARADREGAMAAAGEQVYTGPVTSALSDAAPSPSAAGPMQAKRNHNAEQQAAEPQPAEQQQAVPQQNANISASPDMQSPVVPAMEDIHLSASRDIRAPRIPSMENLPVRAPKIPSVEMLPEEEYKNIRSKRIQSDVDRLYRIQAGLMDEDNPEFVSEADRDFYEKMREDIDYDTYAEIQNRGMKASADLVEYRDNLSRLHGTGPEDKEKRDRDNYEANWSDAGLDHEIYEVLGSQLGLASEGAEKYQRQKSKEDAERVKNHEIDPALEIAAEAMKIGMASDIGVHGTNGAKYLNSAAGQSKEGQEKHQENLQKRLERVRKIYQGN